MHIGGAVRPCIQSHDLGLFPERLCVGMANSPLDSMHGVWLSLDHNLISIFPHLKCVLVTHAEGIFPYAYRTIKGSSLIVNPHPRYSFPLTRSQPNVQTIDYPFPFFPLEDNRLDLLPVRHRLFNMLSLQQFCGGQHSFLRPSSFSPRGWIWWEEGISEGRN